ncbi:MAG: pseudouridine synthase [Pyrobaculum sp.]|nr:pseudouridine synthase [Pyrobaculum sp.]
MTTTVMNVIAYIYGRATAEKLRGRKIDVEYNKSGRIRRIYVDGKLAFVLRNNDGYLLPTLYGATFLERRVILDFEAVEYVKNGRNVPAKYVVTTSQEVRPYGEVAVVDPHGSVVAVGRLMYSTRELTLRRGYAVRVRESLKKATEAQKEPRQ